METKGFVTLVGAGPGDPDLVTVGGRKAIENAQVVLYDRLVGHSILEWIPENAIKVDVGKNSGNHPVPQEEINQLLKQYAQEGKQVVRLKGGDPYLFGRGAEELELLKEAGIPFKVLPGITSAIAVPAYGGIPVTHRDYASSVHIITGHGKRGEETHIPYEALVKLGGTLIFMMSVAVLPEICQGLIEAGMGEDTPAALLENGTRANQRRLISTIKEIPAKMKEEGFKPPSVFMVGRVCTLAEHFDWTEFQPLWGKKMLTASSKATGSKLAKRLRELGCEVTECPVIEMEPIEQPRSFWEGLHRYSWIILTSPYGAKLFFTQLLEQKIDIRALNGLKFGTVGRETAAVMEERGIRVEYYPNVFDGQHLAEGLVSLVNQEDKLLLYRAEEGRAELPGILHRNGVHFTDVPAYKTLPRDFSESGLRKQIAAGEFDAVTFTSGSSVSGFAMVAGGIDYSQIQGVCIGESTAKAARDLGVQVTVSGAASIDSMVECILEKWGR